MSGRGEWGRSDAGLIVLVSVLLLIVFFIVFTVIDDDNNSFIKSVFPVAFKDTLISVPHYR